MSKSRLFLGWVAGSTAKQRATFGWYGITAQGATYPVAGMVASTSGAQDAVIAYLRAQGSVAAITAALGGSTIVPPFVVLSASGATAAISAQQGIVVGILKSSGSSASASAASSGPSRLTTASGLLAAVSAASAGSSRRFVPVCLVSGVSSASMLSPLMFLVVSGTAGALASGSLDALKIRRPSPYVRESGSGAWSDGATDSSHTWTARDRTSQTWVKEA